MCIPPYLPMNSIYYFVFEARCSSEEFEIFADFVLLSFEVKKRTVILKIRYVKVVN
jgi:hypothetical protein